MDLEAAGSAQQGQVEAELQMKIHKKSLEQEEMALQMLEALPPPPSPPGVGGNVDLSA